MALGLTQPLTEVSTRGVSTIVIVRTINSPWAIRRFSCGSNYEMGTAVAYWLRCCATNREDAGSIPDGVIGIFHRHNPSDHTMALGSTQPLTEVSTRGIFLE